MDDRDHFPVQTIYRFLSAVISRGLVQKMKIVKIREEDFRGPCLSDRNAPDGSGADDPAAWAPNR
jgi:hypothetical protein